MAKPPKSDTPQRDALPAVPSDLIQWVRWVDVAADVDLARRVREHMPRLLIAAARAGEREYFELAAALGIDIKEWAASLRAELDRRRAARADKEPVE